MNLQAREDKELAIAEATILVRQWRSGKRRQVIKRLATLPTHVTAYVLCSINNPKVRSVIANDLFRENRKAAK